MDYRLRMLWATPVAEARFPGHARIKQAIVRLCYEREKRSRKAIESGVAPGRKQGLYESDFDLFRAELPEIRELGMFCAQTLHELIVRQARAGGGPEMPPIAVEIHESWCHITRDGGYHEMHIHSNCSWCGIYYLDPGDATLNPPNGINRFYPPIELTYDDPGVIASPQLPVSIAPEEGKLVLFPSYVRHAGLPYRGAKDRILLAFNSRAFYVKPAGDARNVSGRPETENQAEMKTAMKQT